MRLKLLQTSNSDFKVKALDDGSVYLEGWANKAVVDRGKDLIGKKAWKLDNYKKNAIMLFNHDHSKPIGKMISVEAQEEGLYVKGRISNSKDPEISRIRDLVKEGILNSLSVGIMVSDEENRDGVNMVKSAELHEVSVVAVPMNQDSQFTVSTKAMSGPLLDTMELITRAVGFSDVAKACHMLHGDEMIYNSVDDIAEKIATETGISKEKAIAFLRMNGQTPEELKMWLNKADEGTAPTIEENPQDVVNETAVHAIVVPKASFDTMEAVNVWATESGWSGENIKEDGDNYLLVQKPEEDFDGELETVDMGDGVYGLVGKLKTPEPEPKMEGEPEPEAEPKACKPDEEKGLLENADPLTVPITGQTAENIEVNPALDQVKQTNVLLANMVMLLQQLNEKMDMMAGSAKPKVEVEIENTEEPEMTDEEEMTKKVEAFIKKTQERLSTLGL